MLKPTQDKELKDKITQIIKDSRCYCQCKCEDCEVNNTINCSAYCCMDSIGLELAARGYHIGLPESIEWALNSGDGTYRP